MTDIADNTPVIIGVGQYSERVGEPDYEALSYMDLAGRSLKAAIADSGASGSVADAIVDDLVILEQVDRIRPHLPLELQSDHLRIGGDPGRLLGRNESGLVDRADPVATPGRRGSGR